MPDGDNHGMREFISGILRDMQGNAVLLLSTGRSEPTDIAPHGKLRVNAPSWFVYPDELDLMVAFAEKAFADGRDAYISPQIYGDQPYTDKNGNTVPFDRDGRPLYSRSKENALFSQTVYMDSDECPPEKFRLKPSRHVDTSSGHESCEVCGGQPPHGHDYWFLPEPVPANLAAVAAHKISVGHKADGTDPTGWSQNKVLRLPTFNTTYDELAPYPVTWEDDDVDPITGEVGVPLVYDLDTILDVYADVEVTDSIDGPTEYAPPPPLEGLPDFETLLQRIPKSQKRLNDLIFKTPKGGPGGWRSEQRYALLLDLKRFGFTDEETVAVAWHSPAASKWREDKRGVSGLWWELQVRVNPVIAREKGEGISPAPESPGVRLDKRREAPNLLTPEQRRAVATRQDLVTLYLEYSRSKVRNFNAPYATINAWTVMSLGLSEAVEIEMDPQPIGLGIYSYTIGDSSTGKDESYNVARPVISAIYPHDDPQLPAHSSKEDLVANLIERDNKVTYIHDNESDGILAQIKGGGYLSGLFQLWTRGYDGEVPSLGRVGKSDLRVAGKHAILTMHLMGTPAGIIEHLDHKMFYTGYLARQIWVIGEDSPTTKDTMRRKRPAQRGWDGMPAFFGAMFRHLRVQLQRHTPLDRKRTPLVLTDEALDLHAEAAWKIHEHFAKEHDSQLWRPVERRFSDILLKIAGLSAAQNGRRVIGTRDIQVALFYAESWVANAMSIADQISDSHFSKQCDEIEKFIAGRESRRAELGAIYRFRKNEMKFTVDKYLESLVFQGRIEEWTATERGGSSGYRIKERRAS